MKGQRHPKVCVKLTVAEIQAIQEQMDKPDLWEKPTRSPVRRAYAELSECLTVFHGGKRTIHETDDDAGDEY